MAYRFKIEGVENLQRAFGHKLSQIEKVIEKDVDEGADKIKADAKRRAPKKEHNLEEAIDKNKVWNKNGKISIFVGIKINEIFKKADSWYARHQEIGTSKMRARPYLRPSLNENKKKIKSKIESDLRGVLNI
jgi:HK97 gp10 family phage protein